MLAYLPFSKTHDIFQQCTCIKKLKPISVNAVSFDKNQICLLHRYQTFFMGIPPQKY